MGQSIASPEPGHTVITLTCDAKLSDRCVKATYTSTDYIATRARITRDGWVCAPGSIWTCPNCSRRRSP